MTPQEITILAFLSEAAVCSKSTKNINKVIKAIKTKKEIVTPMTSNTLNEITLIAKNLYTHKKPIAQELDRLKKSNTEIGALIHEVICWKLKIQ